MCVESRFWIALFMLSNINASGHAPNKAFLCCSIWLHGDIYFLAIFGVSLLLHFCLLVFCNTTPNYVSIMGDVAIKFAVMFPLSGDDSGCLRSNNNNNISNNVYY